MRKIAVSVGDLNGVGIEIALAAHAQIKEICSPIYCIDAEMLQQASELLSVDVPSDFVSIDPLSLKFTIKPSMVDAKSGRYSFDSFVKAIDLAKTDEVDAIVTLPIHKESWSRARLNYVGHTDFLRYYFNKNAIMMMGCDELYVALFTEHIPLKDVASRIDKEPLFKFLIALYKAIKVDEIAVLALNPHAGDGGVLGDEEGEIVLAIEMANRSIGVEVFKGPVVPDIAFTPHFRERYKYMVAMYHDQALAPLKALYFEQSINISLGLPIVRTSVDHGTAFDIAYKKIANTTSYTNAVKAATYL